nr:cytochrome P450 2C31-like isoform X2 [Pelodiscus sinensis]|eukprot:XP_006135821.1 cytochrome P450 2C31-like isoform X2 [Pelodiscus sinensis]
MEAGAVLILGFLLLLLFFLSFQATSRQGLGRLPPGPAPLPLLGNLTHNVLPLYHSYRRLCQEYGPIFTVWLGPRPTVVLCGSEVLRDALVEHNKEFSGRALVPVLDHLSSGYGHEFDPQPHLTRAVANVICSMVFGTRYSSDNKEFQELLRIIASYMCFFRSFHAQLYNIFSGIMHFLPGWHRRIFRDYDRLRVFIRAQVASHRSNLDPGAPHDFIDHFLLQQAKEQGKEQSEFGDENLVALTNDLFIGGIETTSNTIQFALLVLSKFPEVQARVHRELDRVVGRAQRPALRDRLQLPYTNAVLHELQRYLDLVPMSLPHTTTCPTAFRGYCIPQGTTIIPLLASVHFDPDSWETPEEFNPGHFLDENGAFRKRDTAMPFSAGKRMCLGQGLATVEIFLFVTTLLQSFTLELVTDPGAIDLASLRRAFRGQGLAYKLRAIPRPA